MKIDTIDEIRTEIERRFSEYNHNSNHHIQAAECASILDFIDFLQQEQPEEICSKCIHHRKNDDCYYPYGGMQRRINENGVYECTGFCEKEQEQSEVDLEKEIDMFVDGWSIDEDLGLVNDEGWSVTVGDIKKVARHFYELGLKARKGE